MPSPLLTRLAERPLLCDGAMGTLLYARGVALDACFDVLNLNEPKLVQSVHAEYIAAGCDAIETNTFGANRFKLGIHGLQARVREINLRGAKLARDVRESMGRDVLVLGSIGPLGKYLAPLGSIEPADARAAFHEQAEGLLEGGIDAFVIETFSDLTEMRLAVEAVRALTDLPILAEVAFTDEGVTFTGRTAAEVVRTLRELPIQAVGANCSVGSSVLYDILEQMVPEAGGLHVVIQPNAGLPSRVGERLMYLSSPTYMADYAARMIASGARLVGGCCGTTPQHIRAMREALDRLVAASAAPRGSSRPGAPGWRSPSPPASPPAPRPRCCSAGSTRASSSSRSSSIRRAATTSRSSCRGRSSSRSAGSRSWTSTTARWAACGCPSCPPRCWCGTRPGSTSTCTSPAATGT